MIKYITSILLFTVLSLSVYCQNNTYQYDNLNRLTKVTFTDGTVYEYTYDQLGNRTVKMVSSSASANADLVVQNPLLSQTTMAAGAGTTATFRVANTGTGSAAGHYARLYLSANQTYEQGTDVEIGSVYNSSIAAGSYTQVNKTITIPQGTAPGTWYVLFYADATHLASETDENNNIATVVITIVNCQTMQVSCTTTPATCGFNNGAATASVAGGNQPFTYMWNSGQTTAAISNIAGNTYTVTVTDYYGCVVTKTTAVNTIAPQVLSMSATNTACTSNTGSVSVAVTGGTSPYTYLWNTGQSTASVSNLGAGNYSVTVTDATSCAVSGNITVNTPANIVITLTPGQPTCGYSDGFISAAFTGGIAPFTFLWSNGDTTQNAANLPQGIYTLTITDAGNCQFSASTTLTAINNMALEFTNTNTTCALPNGTATVTATGGTAPYTYLWGNGQTTQTATNLAQGTNYVTVTDVNGCSKVSFATVGATLPPTVSVTGTPTVCTSNIGTATAHVSNGTMPYTYLWSDGQMAQMATGLGAGTYTVTVTDANGCTAMASVTIVYEQQGGAPALPTYGLIAYYPFNGNAHDESGNGNDGTLNNGATLSTDRFGIAGRACSFDGVDDNITTKDNPFDFANHAFTFSLWSKWNADPAAGSNIFDKQGYPANGGNGYRLFTKNDGTLAFAFSSNPTLVEYPSSFIPQQGVWYFLTVVNDGDSVKVYVNGYPVISDTAASILGNAATLTFGKRVDLSGSKLLNGLVDDIRIYNRALNSTEINLLYEEDGFNPQTINTLTMGLVAHYPFNGNANDASGNGNNGTVNGATLTTDRFGNANKSYLFNGNSDISINDNDIMDLQESFSISLWFYNTSNTNSMLLSKMIPNIQNNGSWNIFYTNNKIRFNNWNSCEFFSNELINLNQWYNIVFVYNNVSNTLKLYIDGIQDYSYSIILNISNTNIKTTIGSANSTQEFFNGKIDDIRIYNRILNDAEIDSLYTEGGYSSLNQGLVAFYPFNGNANDASGNGNNGTVNGALLGNDRFGNVNKAYSFDGIDDYIGLPPFTSNSTLSDFTVAVWVKMIAHNSVNGRSYFLCMEGNGSVNNNSFSLIVDNTNGGELHNFINYNGTNYTEYNSPISSPVGQWELFVLQREGSTLRSYINNQLISNSFTGTSVAPLSNLLSLAAGGRIGRHSNNVLGYAANALIDDIRIYNRALNQTEIDSLYTEGGYSTLNQGLVAYYPFNGNANDESGNGNNGTVNGATLTADRFGNANKAYNFDGTSQYINIGNASSLKMSNNITIATWLKIQDVNIHHRNIISDHSNSYNNGKIFRIDILSQKIEFLLGAEYSPEAGHLLTQSDVTQWIFVVATYDGSKIRFYYNGCQVDSCIRSGAIDINPNNLLIGSSSDFNEYFGGKIDDIRIYNRALNNSEIQSLYSEGGYSTLNQGLVVYYPFNGNANDESGNGNNGTVNGATLTTDRFGNANKAYNFDGINDYIESNKHYLDGPFSLQLWVKAGTLIDPGTINILFSNGYAHGVSGNGISGWINDLGVKLLKAPESTGYEAFTNIKVNDNIWHQLVFIWDGTSNTNGVKIYTDGVLSCSYTCTSTTINSTHNLSFGGSGSFCKGSLDDIRLYNRTLSESEIDSLYTEGGYSTLNQGLVAYYPFNGNANDESGNGNNGTVNGATLTADRFGNAGKAYSFDGSNDYITVANNFFNNGWPGYTISGWFSSSNTNKTQQCFFNTIPHNGTNLQLNYSSSNKLNFFINSNPGIASWDISSNTSGSYTGFTNNTWCHYAFVKNGNNYKLYLNGALDANFDGSISPISYLCSVVFGSINPAINLSECFAGKLDDIRIYNRALTNMEIQELYYQSPSTPLSSSIIAQYPFNGNANDESGHGHHGAVNGASLTTDRYGNPNSAYSFDGVNDVIDLPSGSNIQGNNPRTVTAWYYLPNEINANGYCIYKGGTNGTGNDFTLFLSKINSAHYCLHLRRYMEDVWSDTIELEPGTWSYFAVTYDGTTNNGINLYKDGQQLSLINPGNGSIFNTPSVIPQIGDFTDQGSNHHWALGKIDDITIYNRSLTASEISQLYTVPPPPEDPVSIFIGNDTTICENASMVLDAGAGFNSYLWSTGANTQTITVSNLTSGTHQYAVRIDACGSIGYDTINISVNLLPAQTGPITGNTTVISGTSQTYSIAPVSGATSYTWYYNGNVISGSTGTSITFSPTSNFLLSVVANNDCGSSMESTLNVTVYSPVTYTVTTASNPTGGGTTTGGGTFSGGQTCTATAHAANGYTFLYWEEGGQQLTTDSVYVFNVTANRNLTARFFLMTTPFVTECQNLDNNQIPNGWLFSEIQSAASVTGSKMMAYTDNAEGVLYRPGTMPAGIQKVVLEWDGDNAYSNSGRMTYTEIKDSLNTRLLFSNATSVLNGSPSETYVQILHKDAGGNILHSIVANGIHPFANENYHYKAIIKNDSVLFTATSQSNQTELFSYAFKLSSVGMVFPISSIRQMAFGARTTTDNNSWVDNPCVTLLSEVTINATVSPPGSGTVSGTGVHIIGQTVVLEADSATGYTFLNWTENGTVVSTDQIYSFVAAIDRTLVANFECTLPYAAGTITGNNTACQGENSVTYSVPVIPHAASYVWTLPTGATGTSTTNSITVDYGTTAVSGNITVKGHNSCGDGTVATLAITVNPLPLSAGTITGSTTVCQGQSTVTYTVPTITNATSYIWTLPTGATGSSTTNTITVNYSTAAVSGNITVKGHNSCGDGTMGTLAITVNPLPLSAGTITGSTTVCQGQSAVTYTVPIITSATSYIWTLPTGATGTSTTNSITVDYGTTAVSGNITVKGHNSCGDGTEATLAITVNPLPGIAELISGSSTVCQGQSGLIYTVPAITNATSYIWTLPTGATGSSSTNSITVNYSTSATSGNISVKGHNNCGDGTTSIFIITVNPLPLSAGTITGSTTVCQGQSAVTYTVPAITNATSYIWTLPTGASGTSTTNSITVSYGTTAVSGNITVKGHNSCGDGTVGTLAITVNPLPLSASTITGSTTVCQGQSTVTYTVPTITNATSYIWTLPTGATGTSTTNSITVDYGTTAVSGNITVKGHNACGDGSVATLAITVNPLPLSAGTITGSTTVCQGQSAVTYSVPNITNATSYIWTLPTGATGTSTTNSITVNYGTTAVSGNITVKGHNACGDGTVATVAITVNPLPLSAGTITGSTTVCQGQSAVTYTVPSITNATSYIWTLPTGATGTSTTNSITVSFGTTAVSGNITVKGHNSCGDGTVGTLAITVNPLPLSAGTITGSTTVCQGQSAVTYSVPSITNATSYIWTLPTGATGTSSTNTITIDYGSTAVSGNITVKGHNACGDGTVGTLAVTVNPLPLSAGTITGSTTVCQEQSAVTYTVPSITNATSYIWTLPTGATGTSTTNSITVSFGTTAVSGNITVKGHNSCGDGTVGTLAITVNPLPLSAGTITGSTTVCQGQSAVTYTVPAITNATSYIWTLPTGATGTSTTNSITVDYGTTAVSGNITVKGHNSCGDGTVGTLAITVNPLPLSAGTITGSTTVCQGQSAVTYTVPAITNATSYIWTLPTGATGTSTTNSITVDYGTTAVSGNITAKGHNSCGDGTEATLVVTVNPLPANAGSISGSTTVCQGQSSVTYTVPVIANASTYIWALPSGASGTSTTNSITVTYSTVATTSNITVLGHNACGDGVASTQTITVNPLPLSAGTISGNTTVCQGQSALTYTVPAITNATSYIWTLPSGVTGTSTTNSITVSYGTTAMSGNITVKGHNTCGDGTESLLPISVNPLPANAGVISGNTTVCQGQNTVIYTVPTIANAGTYIWSLPSGANGTSNTNTITINYSTSAASSAITVIGHNNCGDGIASALSITVNPLPSAAGGISGSTTVCQGQTSVTYSVPLISNADSYIWVLPNGATGSSTTNSITVDYGTSAVSGNITVKGHNNCGDGTISTLAVTVNPLPESAGTITGNITVCQGENTVIYTLPTITNATSYIWTLPTGATGVSTTNSITVDYGTTAVSGNIIVKGHNSCGDGTAATLAVTVNPLPLSAGTITGSTTVCQGQSAVTYTVPTITNATSYIWTLPTGATGANATNSITIDYGTTAASGNVTVKGHNACGDGTIASLVITVNPLPVSAGSITGSTTVCQGQSAVTYTVPTTTNATSYIWTLPTGATGTSATNSISVDYGTSAVSGNITVEGHNACGDGTIATLPVTVNPLPENAGIITGDDTVCQGQNGVIYNVPVIANASSYLWTLPTGASGNSNTNSITVNYNTTAIAGVITVKGQNSCGEGGMATLNIAVNLLPDTAGTISGSDTVCQGTNAVTYNVPLIDNALTYNWILPAGVTGISNTNSITVDFGAGANTGNIQVMGTNACGNGISSSYEVIVDPLPDTAGQIVGSISVCQGQKSVVYTVPAIGHTDSYTWVLPTGASGSSTTDSITVEYSNSAPSGIISVYGVNACGAGVSSSLSVTVNPLPGNAGTITGPASVCQGQGSVIYSVPVIPDADSYYWDLPFGYTGSSTTNTITLFFDTNAVSGNINVYGINLCGDGASSSFPVIVSPLPDSAGIISGPSSVCQAGDSVIYSISSIDNATEYIWSLPAGVNGSSTTTAITVYYDTTSVSGIVSVWGQNACGSGFPSTLVVTVNEKPETPVITINGSTLLSDAATGNQWYNNNGPVSGATNQYYIVPGNGNYFCIVTINGCSSDTSNTISVSTGLDGNFDGTEILVYPNPVSQELVIEFKGNADQYTYELYNSLGQVVHKGKLREKVVVRMTDYAKGVYLLKIGNDKVWNYRKVVKE